MNRRHENTAEESDRGFRVTPRLIIAVVVAALALVFVFQNTGEGRVDFLMWTFTLPTWIWLLVIFAAGVVTGSLFPWMRRQNRRTRR